jgi:protein SCO1/2
MKLRTASRLSVIALVVVVGAILYVARASLASPQPTSLVGTNLGGTPAPDFRLTDQHDAAISLALFRGEPVVLTFMTAHCGSACAQATAKVRTALDQLGTTGSHVAVLVVSMDPHGDDAASVAAFSQQLLMADRLHYLTGTCATLPPVWKAYGVAGADCASGASVPAAPALGLYLIDTHGRERVYLNSSFSVSALATDLRSLSAP